MAPFLGFHHSERVALAVKECLGFYPFRSLCPTGEGKGLCWWIGSGAQFAILQSIALPPSQFTLLHRLRTFNPWEGWVKRIRRATRGANSCCESQQGWFRCKLCLSLKPRCLSFFQKHFAPGSFDCATPPPQQVVVVQFWNVSSMDDGCALQMYTLGKIDLEIWG